MLVRQNDFTHTSISQNISNFFLTTFNRIRFSEIAWYLLICIFTPKLQAISIIFRAEHIYISLSGLSIKRSGKKKSSYMHYPQCPLKMSSSSFHMPLFSNTKFWRKVPCIFLLSLPKHRTRAQRNENVGMRDI